MNKQPIEKQFLSDKKNLSVISIFKTIQGEGPYTGHSCIFIRLAGCNLQCPGCDTEYTEGRITISNRNIIDKVNEIDHSIKLVVITGGEPFRQYITPLCNTLIKLGYKVQIESNGTLAPFEDLNPLVTIVCSPKAGKVNKLMEKRADAYKYVMHHDSINTDDGLPLLALDHSARPMVARPPLNFQGAIYLQPMDSQSHIINKLNMEAVKQSCLKFNYILQLQIHKIIGVE